MNLVISASANRQMTEILDHIRNESPAGADGLSRRFDDLFEHIAEFPGAGRPTNRKGMRWVNTHPYPYLLFYRQRISYVEVSAIIHGARNPRSMPARLR